MSNFYYYIPKELKDLNQWVVWGIDEDNPKCPFNPKTMTRASAGDPSTWASFAQASDITESKKAKGIGFEFHNNGYYGIDLDNVIANGRIVPEAQEIVKRLNSYTEVSPSRTGLHIFVKADGIELNRNKGKLTESSEIEIYCEKRYFTVNGVFFQDLKPIQDRTKELQEIYDQYLGEITYPQKEQEDKTQPSTSSNDSTYLDIGLKKDKIFASLWEGNRPNGNESSDDQALFNKLAYWCNANEDLMLGSFLDSPHYNQKDTKHKIKCSRYDYMQRTINRALIDVPSIAKDKDKKFRLQQAREDFAEPLEGFEEDYSIKIEKKKNISTKKEEQQQNLQNRKKSDIKQFFDDKKFLHHIFGDYMIEKYHIKYINGKLHIYDDGIYINDESLIEHLMIKEIKFLTSMNRTEVKKYIQYKLYSRRDVKEIEPEWIPLKNELFNVTTGESKKYDPSIVVFNKIDHELDPNAESEKVEKFLRLFSNNDEQVYNLICEVIGYMLYRSTSFDSFFTLVGKGGNGKSTFLNMITQLLGIRNICNLTLQELNDRFKPYQVQGKLVNIGDDIPSTYILDDSIIKKMITGEPITVERKGKDPYVIKPKAKHIYSANKIPKIKGATYGTERRLVVIPCDYQFSDNESVNRKYRDKTYSETDIQYLLKVALDGLKNLLKNNKFTIPEVVVKATQEYIDSNNPIKEFLDENSSKFFEMKVSEAYQFYRYWCNDCGYVPLNLGNFKAELKLLGINSKAFFINGKTVRKYYTEKIFTVITNDTLDIPNELLQ